MAPLLHYREKLTEEQNKNYIYNIKILGKLFKSERSKHNISALKIAELAKCDNSTIYRFENGSRINTPAMVAKIIRAFQDLKQVKKNAR